MEVVIPASIPEGNHVELVCAATDAAGNEGDAKIEVAVDLTPLTASLVFPHDGAVLLADDDLDGDPGNDLQYRGRILVTGVAPLTLVDGNGDNVGQSNAAPAGFDYDFSFQAGDNAVVFTANDASGMPYDLQAAVEAYPYRPVVEFDQLRDGHEFLAAHDEGLDGGMEVTIGVSVLDGESDEGMHGVPVRIHSDVAGVVGEARTGDEGVARVPCDLPPGDHTLRAEAGDGNGNVGVSAEVAVEAQATGCGAYFVRPAGSPGNPAILGIDDDLTGLNDGWFRVDVEARVDVAAYRGLPVTVYRDGQHVVQNGFSDSETGVVLFSGVALPDGG